jgi:hypothetical protein
MKTLLSVLAATLLSSLAFSTLAQQMSPAERALAVDCSKGSRPELCMALKEAEKSCMDKPTREEQKVCVKAFLKERNQVKQ